MIKSTFSRNAKKLPPSCSSKKLSLAGLAQKLQHVDINSTSSAEYTLPENGTSNPLLLNSLTDDGNNALSDSGKYTTSLLVTDSEEHCSNPDISVICPDSKLVDSTVSVATCISKQDENESIGERKCTASSADGADDCAVQFDRLFVDSVSHTNCRLAKPTPFGQTLSAIPNPLKRAKFRQRKSALYARFSYFHQMGAVAGMHQRHYGSNAQTIVPFDFSTASPDDVVQKKQKLAFGEHVPTKRL